MKELIYKSPQNPNSHLTVKDRSGPSFPTKQLFVRNMISGRVLDFGCGLGVDVNYLEKIGYEVVGFDPQYAPEEPQGKFDTIICNYVLNVLLADEQSYVLMAISELLKPSGRAFFTVRRDIKRNGFRTHIKHGCQVYQCNVTLPYHSIFRNDYCEIYEYRHYNQINHLSLPNCHFCSPPPEAELITESALVYAFLNNESEISQHAIIIPKMHIESYFDLPPRTKMACWIVLDRVDMRLKQIRFCSGMVVEIRIGEEAGQKYDHTHISLIQSSNEKKNGNYG